MRRASTAGGRLETGGGVPTDGTKGADLPPLLESLGEPAIVFVGDVPPGVRRKLAALAPGSLLSLDTAPPDPPATAAAAVVVARDVNDLRRLASCLPDLGSAEVIACWLLRGASGALTLHPRPLWPPLVEIVSTRQEHSVLRATFARPVSVRDVLLELADSATPVRRRPAPWPVAGVSRESAAWWPLGESNTVALEDMAETSVLRGEIPDFVIRSVDEKPVIPFRGEAESVMGRPIAEVTIEPPPAWSDLGGRTSESHPSDLPVDPLALGPLDEAVLNPIGFRRESSVGLTHLSPDDDPRFLRLRRDTTDRRVATRPGPTQRDIAFLRRSTGVVLDWRGARGPAEYCRVVAGLAMAGVPLASADVPTWAGAFLPESLVRALVAPDELEDPLRREETSIRQRRAALSSVSAWSWRAAAASRAGLAAPAPERVSALLPTRRPEMVHRAVSAMQIQRGVELEILVATHGFTLSAREKQELSELGPFAVRVLDVEASLPFGEVMNVLAQHADNQLLLKVDDDDLYGPDFVLDLTLARRYSAGDVVGCPAELTYLSGPDITIRRKARTEVFHRTVAGGAMLIPRGTLHGVGGFRPHTRYIDASLLRAVHESGGHTYRTHGLGFMLYRRQSGHTWNPGLDYFLQEHRIVQRWPGFHPTEPLRCAVAPWSPNDRGAARADPRGASS